MADRRPDALELVASVMRIIDAADRGRVLLERKVLGEPRTRVVPPESG